MTFAGIIGRIYELVFSPLLTFFVGAALVWFLWGVLQYVTAGGDTSKRSEGLKMISYGIIAIFVMVSVWGLVAIVTNTLGVSPGYGLPQ